MNERNYIHQTAEEKLDVDQHSAHVTKDVTRVSDPRMVLYCTRCKVYFDAGEHPNIIACGNLALA